MTPSIWYITAAALREYITIAGLATNADSADWATAENELAEHCAVSREAGRNHTGTIYRTGRVRCGTRPQAIRLELTVREDGARHNDDRPQLVRVREKGGNRGTGQHS